MNSWAATQNSNGFQWSLVRFKRPNMVWRGSALRPNGRNHGPLKFFFLPTTSAHTLTVLTGQPRFAFVSDILKKPMNLQNSYAEVGYLQSNKYKNHIPCDVNDPSGGLGVFHHFLWGWTVKRRRKGWTEPDTIVSQISKDIKGIFWIYPPLTQ